MVPGFAATAVYNGHDTTCFVSHDVTEPGVQEQDPACPVILCSYRPQTCHPAQLMQVSVTFDGTTRASLERMRLQVDLWRADLTTRCGGGCMVQKGGSAAS
jgi:hypothetical protein